METILGKNWKTTLAGCIAGGGIAVNAVLQAAAAGTFSGKSGEQLVLAIGIFLLGLWSKDHNTTGAGTTATKVS